MGLADATSGNAVANAQRRGAEAAGTEGGDALNSSRADWGSLAWGCRQVALDREGTVICQCAVARRVVAP
jgi:hypothetical protein